MVGEMQLVPQKSNGMLLSFGLECKVKFLFLQTQLFVMQVEIGMNCDH